MPEIGVLCSQIELRMEIEKTMEQLLGRFPSGYRLRCLSGAGELTEAGSGAGELTEAGSGAGELTEAGSGAGELSEAGAGELSAVGNEVGVGALSCLVLSAETREAGFALAEMLWQKQPAFLIIYVARQMEDVFAALGYPFFHTVRAFALETDLQAAIRKLERMRPPLPAGHSFQCGTQIVRFFRKDILYLESDRHEIRIHLIKGVAETTEPLGQCEEKLRAAGFVRIHKSFLVNMYHVSRLERDSLFLSNGEQLYISRYRYAEVKLQFESYIRHLDFMS